MFGDLPKLLDREFLFGFFLPATLFVAGSLLLGVHFGLVPLDAVLEFAAANPTAGSVIAVLAIWLVAGFLLALNSSIMRAKEGYGWRRGMLHPLTLLHRAIFRRIRHMLAELDRTAAGSADPEQVPPRVLRARISAAHRLANGFPADESRFLPTAFGNTIRAFEDYPLVMYNLDAIAAWSRLQMVIPGEYRRLVDGAKSQVDFMLNLWAVWWVLLLEYAWLAVRAGSFSLWWFPVVAGIGILVCSRRATGAAIRWGDRVKAAFDVFLPALSRELGLAPAPTLDKEREIWDCVSRAFLFRDPDELRRAKAATGTGPRRLPFDGPGSATASRGSSG